MSLNYQTARDIDTNLKASSKYRKVLTYEGYSYPVIPVTANTYKTGKHGAAKTRMLLKNYFTESTFATILDSDAKFFDMESSTCFSLCEGVIESTTSTGYWILDSNYESLFITHSNPKKENIDLQVGYVKWTLDNETCYKIRSIGTDLVDA